MPEGENSVVNEQGAAQDPTSSEATTDQTATSDASNGSAPTGEDASQSNTAGGYVDDSGAVILDEDKPQSNENTADPESASNTEATTDETDPKRGANARIRGLANENRSLRDELAQRDKMIERITAINERAYPIESAVDIPSVEYLMENEINPDTREYYTATEAKIFQMEARDQIREQQIQRDDYNRQVADNQNRMVSDAEQAIRDFPMFDSESSEYNKELAQAVDAELQANIIIDDKTGQPIGWRRGVYDIYRTANALFEAGKLGGQVNGQRSAEQMMARADNVGNGQRSAAKSFENLSLKDMEAELRRRGHDV